MTRQHLNRLLLITIVAGVILFIGLSITTSRDATLSDSAQSVQSSSTPVTSRSAEASSTNNALQQDRVGQLIQQQCQRLDDPALISHCVSSARQDIQAGKLEPVIPDWDPNACNAITDVLEQHRCHAELGRDFAISTGDLARCRVIPLADIQADCRSAIIINQIKTLVALENTLDAGDPGVAIP